MATKAKKATRETWYDTFAEWDGDDQARAIEMLTAMNRQTYAFERRDGRRKENKAKEADKPVVTTPIWPCGFCGGKEADGHLDKCPNKATLEVCPKCGLPHPGIDSCLQVVK
jgi:rubrerythrin